MLYSRDRDPVPFVQEAEWEPEPVWTVAENPVPPEFDPRIVQTTTTTTTTTITTIPIGEGFWKFGLTNFTSQVTIFMSYNSEVQPTFIYSVVH